AAACRLLTAKSISGSAGSCAGIDGCSSAASSATCLPCCHPDRDGKHGVLGSGRPPPLGWDESHRGCVPGCAQGGGNRVTAPGRAQEPPGCPFSFLCSSSKDKSKAVLQQKYVRCSVRAQIRHLRRVLCHRLGLQLQHVQILFNGEALPDHMTMKQLWLSRWFGKVGVGVGPPPCSKGGEGRGLRPRSREVWSHG
uniref:RAWUL domain-containing protein n=1 Tax=Meleagris gallopavo TaxID=9103 RepID=A0A803YRD3_MELGA